MYVTCISGLNCILEPFQAVFFGRLARTQAMGGDARANQQHLWETLAATKLLGMVGAPPINLLSIGIGDNVGKTIIHHPFGNGKHTTYENCDFWDDLLGLPH